MVDPKAVFECHVTANSDSKCGLSLSFHFCSTKVGSLDRAPALQSRICRDIALPDLS